MKKTVLVLAVMVLAVSFSAAAWADDVVVQMPKHGSLWKLAEECGQPGTAWKAVMAKNPWLKIKKIKGKSVPVVYAGQPILLPDDWVDIDEETEEKPVTILAALWTDYCDMGKTYPIPCALVAIFIVGIIMAKREKPT